MASKLSQEEFIQKANKVHNNFYNYSLVKYVNARTKIKIICPIHGEFEQTADIHLRKCGCSKCSKNHQYSTTEFVENSIQVHGAFYNYSKVSYINKYTKVEIICPIHGEFEQTPHAHIHQKQGCPICKFSKGELVIETYLRGNHIKFESQKRFKNCKNKRPLPFDFYLTEYNTCIEFDGQQHFIPFSFNHDKTKSTMNENLKLVQEKDKIKDEYCLNNNIRLVRIPYWDLENIVKYFQDILA